MASQSTYMLPYYALARAQARADVSGVVERILERIAPRISVLIISSATHR
jgi:hypothetical protein